MLKAAKLQVTSPAYSGPGTLREALGVNEPRTIVAGTDGVIRLESPIQAGGGHVTVNFLTPPGGGITLTGQTIRFDSMTDVVLLGLRYRGTDSIDDHNDQNRVDCVTLTSVKRAVVAHGSFFGCVDEAVSIERARQGAAHLNEDITIQYNLFWEGCMADCQEGQGHARPINVSRGRDRVAIHHNVMAGNQQRSPQLAGCVDHPGCLDEWPPEPTGFVGYNLIAHWLNWATHVKNGARADIIGNVYIPGPEAQEVAIAISDNELLGTILYLSGNQECASWGMENCFPASSSTGMGALSASSLSGLTVSAIPPETLRSRGWIKSLGPNTWDSEDERALDRLVDGTMQVGGGYNPDTYQPLVPMPAPRLADRDGDAIPDSFDQQPDLFSAWVDSNSDGWSDLEAYLFELPIDRRRSQ